MVTPTQRAYVLRHPTDRTVPAACEQVGCLARRRGWETTCDLSTELGRRQAAWIRSSSGRTFTEVPAGAGVVVFRFAPGQRCFAEHRTLPTLYLVRHAHRGRDLGAVRRHSRPADMVEDWATHLDTVREDMIRHG